ncbi:hypothetical protein HELRODRAFT_169769 [Helobdella robusta]|uniref:Calcineurin-like phosphoesterase domain-containing protein n=1 Tax=Helobdella robusta TaxID=6412 RepID=T1F2B3_HELRO|nr:hypothetical protein HELRODRAFT_169769 [Helobdella robusta]ESO08047.1 hypothetical protein HELRODRAFT_169769 [Helobdella robusta]
MSFMLVKLLFVGLLVSYVNTFHLIVIGDWGDDNENQYRTARGMSALCQTVKCNGIISTGDNIYPAGVKSVNDPRFNTSWRNVYNLKGIQDKYWLMSMGNHDHDGNYKAQIEYTNVEPRWHLPSLWYDAQFQSGAIHLFSIDTVSIEKSVYDYKKQLQWLEDKLSKSKATWKVVFGHHPPVTGGKYAPGVPKTHYKIVPLLEKYKVDLYLAGHDHNLQHISKDDVRNEETKWIVDYVVSGGGGRKLAPKTANAENELMKRGYKLRFFRSQFGFVSLEFSKSDLLNVRYFEVTKPDTIEITYTFNRTKSAI